MPTIVNVPMRQPSLSRGRPGPVRMVVLHATASTYPSGYNWLRQGGSLTNPTARVSVHYHIDKQGTITQFVADFDTAWHAGKSTWTVDGRSIPYEVGCNPVAIGIELENRNDGVDPYPPAQYDAARWLVARLVTQYAIPRTQLVRHLDIAPQRKTDPKGFPWARFVEDVYAAHAVAPLPPVAVPSVRTVLTEASAIFGPSTAAFEQVIAFILKRGSSYGDYDVRSIVKSMFTISEAVNVNPVIVAAQAIHETSDQADSDPELEPFSSAWAQRPHRNPAGIGVTGVPGAGVSFPTWNDGIQAQVGRLLRYFLRDGQGTDAQQLLMATALHWRALDRRCWGSATELKHLGAIHNPVNAGKPRNQWVAGWAWSGEQYGRRIAEIANAIAEVRI